MSSHTTPAQSTGRLEQSLRVGHTRPAWTGQRGMVPRGDRQRGMVPRGHGQRGMVLCGHRQRGMVPRGHRQRGMVMIVYTISMALIVLVLGLAIDGGVLYLIKGRLQAASDAGALAAARSLNLSLTPAQQDADAATASTCLLYTSDAADE